MTTDPQPTDRARVWHLAGVGNPPIPTDHATWNELRARHDLVEVLAEDPGGTP